MKNLLWVLLGIVVPLALTSCGVSGETGSASLALQSPIETPTQPSYPLPTALASPTPTRPPKPLPSPSPIPTATPIPSPLPLPPSAFYALWEENFPEGQGSVLWIADPRDIGSRKEILRFERDRIIEAALSPDGRKLALVTTHWKTSTLWVADVDGSNLHRVDEKASGPLLWSRDSRLLAYSVGWHEEVMVPGEKTGTPVPIPVWRGAVELLNVTTGEKRQLLEMRPEMRLRVLGWSADGRELYYSLSIPQEAAGYAYELWAIDKWKAES